jgi:phage tail sheath protein FI
MPDYRTPGVYIEEQLATGPISGVGTSTAAFLGVASRGPVGVPEKITNLAQFTNLFVPAGPLVAPYANLVRGVRGFFENGGTVAYITRIASPGRSASVTLDTAAPEKPALDVTAVDVGEAGNELKISVSEPTAQRRFDVTIKGPGGEKDVQTVSDLSMDPTDTRFVGTALRETRVRATPSEGADGTPPARVDDVALSGGTNDRAGEIGADDDWTNALAALAKVDDVSLVCAPGVTAESVQAALVAHCEVVTQDRFAILDSAPDAPPTGDDSVLTQRGKVESPRGFAALYYPWLRTADPDVRGATLLVPPSGHVAGVFARVDAQRGVHKAPANELITGALGLERVLDDVEHGELNVAGINVLRVFAGRSRPTVWGARTTSAETAWRHVNVRRLFLFIEESIQEGIRWAVFEPNDLSLWKRLDRTITEFLTRVWSSGALFGATADEAFYVRIDKSNNPDEEIALGKVVVEIGVAPVRPAEFVIVRIGIWAGGGQVQEG